MYAAPTGQPANVCLPGGAVKTAPYKAPVNGDPRKKQQKNTFNILQMFGL